MAEPVNLLEMIRQQTPRVVQAVRNARAVAVDNSMKAEKVVGDMEQLAVQTGKDQAIVVQTAQIGQLNAQNAARKALDAAGGMDALYDTIATLRAEQVRLVPELENLRQETLASTGFSPIQAIKNKLDWNGTQSKVAASIQTIKAVSDVGQEIEQRVNAAGQLARGTAETMTVASVEAATRAAQTEWQMRAAQARLEGLKYNTQSMEAIAGAEDKTLEVLTRAATFERMEEQFQLSLREEARRAAQFDFAKEEALAKRAERLSEKGMDDRIVYKINLGRASRGEAPITGPEAQDMIKMFRGNNPEMLDLYKKGEYAERTGISLIGYSPADTAKVVAANPQLLQTLPAERQKALALVIEAQNALAAARGTPGSPLSDDKDGTKAAAYINKYVTDKAATLSTSVGNNLDNPFHVGDLSSYIGTPTSPGVSAFQTYPLVTKVLNTAIAGNVSLTDPNTVIGLAQAAVRKGDLTSSQAAADISNIYRRANLLHRSAVGFNTLGIALPKNGGGYVAKINGEMVDVTDFQSVARAMNKTMAQDAYGRMQSMPAVGPSGFAATYGRAISETARVLQNRAQQP
jgi:hypothetical protein